MGEFTPKNQEELQGMTNLILEKMRVLTIPNAEEFEVKLQHFIDHDENAAKGLQLILNQLGNLESYKAIFYKLFFDKSSVISADEIMTKAQQSVENIRAILRGDQPSDQEDSDITVYQVGDDTVQ